MRTWRWIQAVLVHLAAGGVTFLILGMAAQIGLGLRATLKGLPANLPVHLAYLVGDHGLELFCLTAVVANVLPLVIARRRPPGQNAGIVAIMSAVAEVLWAITIFLVVTYAAISIRQ